MATKVVEDSNVLQLLQDITKHQLRAKAFIQDIQDNVEDEQELESIRREVKKAMEAIKSKIEELVIVSKEQIEEEARNAIISYIESHRQELTGLQGTLRKACLTAQVLLDNKARTALLSDDTNSDIPLKKRARKDKESLVKMSADITSNMMAISRTLYGQVEQNKDSLETLAGSSQKVTDTHEELKSMGGIIHQSRKLLSKYNRREFTDKVLIFLALAFFFACVLYVMKRRLW